MIENKSVLAIIVARGGSKGLPGKNIKPLHGKPLVAWTVAAGLASKYIDRLILSTDDTDIANVARQHGCEVPFMRPKQLAQDHTPVQDVLLHAIEALDQQYDVMLLLQAASPLRRAEDIDAGLECWAEKPQRPLVSVVKSSKSPYWMYTLNGHEMTPVLPSGLNSARRQEHPDFYVLNGALYVMAVNDFQEKKNYFQSNTEAFVMDIEHSVDIDSAYDFYIAEAMLARQAG